MNATRVRPRRRASGNLTAPSSTRTGASWAGPSAVPPAGAVVRVPGYHTGGGMRGNVTAHALSVLKSSIPYVARVDNRRAAVGGVDGEDIEAAKIRGPIILRTRDRAVTAEDFEHLAREAAPELARVHCVVAGDGADAGSVRVLVVPGAAGFSAQHEHALIAALQERIGDIPVRLERVDQIPRTSAGKFRAVIPKLGSAST